jgi:hypothetical protein
MGYGGWAAAQIDSIFRVLIIMALLAVLRHPLTTDE